ncbi:MAG: hypothetical protein ACFE0R_00020 [Salinarimonas sp.]
MRIKAFYPNEADDLHCLQASVRMVYESLTGNSMTVEEAEQFTGFKTGEQTWPFDMMLGFAGAGFNVVNIEVIDNELFARDPRAAAVAEFGEEMWAHFERVSDIERAQESARKCVEHPRIRFERKIPTPADLRAEILAGKFAICNVNYRELADQSGYNGHFVVVEDVAEDGKVVLQNPGLPPIENQAVTLEKFVKAWYFPNERAGNIIAVG